MEDRVTLSYFYGKEADQYSFYKIPKLLFTDDHYKSISVESKVLYTRPVRTVQREGNNS